MEFHEVANIFPMMSEREYEELKADIKLNGLMEPIWLYQSKIIDGRNRYNACLEVEIEPRFRDYDGDDVISFVISLNLHRRHLSESQRAMVASKVANLTKSDAALIGHGATANLQSQTRAKAAEMLNVSERSVNTAKKVEQSGVPALKEAVETGRVSVSAAADISDLPQEEQQEVIAKGEKEILKKAKEIRAQKAKERKEEKIKQLKETKPVDGKYRVIYADPPWKYGDSREQLTGTTGAEHHYPTMSIDELCAIPIKGSLEDDAVLFIWVTSPLLEESFRVIKSWGFKYKASFVWDKVKHNLGHYNSVRHEFLLICTCGSCTPDINKLHDSVVELERTGKHSEKPEYFRSLIDELYPYGNRIELFRRGDVPQGWEVWGNEVSAA